MCKDGLDDGFESAGRSGPQRQTIITTAEGLDRTRRTKEGLLVDILL